VDTNTIFGNSISLGIRTGITEISYPRDRLFGAQGYDNQDEDPIFRVRYTRPQDDDTWIKTIIGGYSSIQVSSFGYLMFVHGFNTSFDYALRQSAQLKVDLDFKGPMLMFS
jgi:esterase/lipase superfamily enzyme